MKYRLELPNKFNKILTKNKKPVKIIGDCAVTYSMSMGIDGAKKTGFTTDEEGEKERLQFEKDLSLQEDALKPFSKYWDNFAIKVPSGGVTLDDSNILDKLKLKVLLSDTAIAKSVTEYENNPSKYILVLRSELLEANHKNAKRELIGKAYTIIGSMSIEEKRNALLIYGKNSSLLDSMSPETIDSELGDYMELDYDKFIKIAGDTNLKVKSRIIRYINKGVIVRGTGKKTYEQDLYFNGECIGTGLEDVALFIMDSKNSKIKSAIESQFKINSAK